MPVSIARWNNFSRGLANARQSCTRARCRGPGLRLSRSHCGGKFKFWKGLVCDCGGIGLAA
eukprot:2313448-Alexandrium_andersonii.AAC.1